MRNNLQQFLQYRLGCRVVYQHIGLEGVGTAAWVEEAAAAVVASAPEVEVEVVEVTMLLPEKLKSTSNKIPKTIVEPFVLSK